MTVHAQAHNKDHDSNRCWESETRVGSMNSNSGKGYSILVSLVVALHILVGCGQGSDSLSQSEPGGAPESQAKVKKGTIGLSVLTLTNPFFKVIADTLAAEAAKRGYDVIVTSGELDIAKQQNQVKDFIVKKVSVIVLTPCDSKAIAPVIMEANEAGIPVFTADIACMMPEARVITHIATDNYQGGRLAAKAVLEAISGKGKVAILDHPIVESAHLRVKGFHDELAEANKDQGVNVEVMASLAGDGARDKSFKVAQDLLQAHPDLNAIFAVNDPSAFGVIAALEEAGKAEQIAVIGFDGQPEGKRAIKEGKIYADPVQFPDKIGRETFRVIMKYLEGEKVPAEILIPTELYRKADADKDPLLKE